MSQHTKSVTINGDTLTIEWNGSVWVAPCCGAQYGRARDAMAREVAQYLCDCGEPEYDDVIEEIVDGMTDDCGTSSATRLASRTIEEIVDGMTDD